MLSFDSMPLDPLTPKLTMQLSAGAQIPMTQRLARIDYIIECRIQALTWNKHILAVSTIKYQNKFITDLRYPVFGHGQFYVGVSRGTNWNRVKVLLERGVNTTNIVYKDILLRAP